MGGRKVPPRVVYPLLMVVVAVVLASCGADSPGAQNGANGPLTAVSYRGPVFAGGWDAPLYYAKKLGYYAENGLDVELGESKGSTQTVNDVSTGGTDFGMANASTVIISQARDLDVTSVATPVGKSVFGFYVPVDSGITTVAGLRGNSVAAGSTITPVLNASLSGAGLESADVTPVLTDISAVLSTYMTGKADATYSTAYSQAEIERRRPSKFLPEADAGFTPPGYALIVRPSYLAKNTEVVRKFVAATLRGFEAAKQDPEAATDALVAAQPTLDREHTLNEVKALISHYCSQAQQGQPFGSNSEQDWEQATRHLVRTADLPASTDASRMFTNRLFDGTDKIDVGTC